MSRADAAIPGVGAAARTAASDFYYHSIRLVAANAIWGAGVVALLLAWVAGAGSALFLLAPLLAVPLSGVCRLAGLISRRRDVVLSDAWREWRRQGGAAVIAGAAVTVTLLALTTNVLLGLSFGGLGGWTLATFAGWGLVALWAVAFPLFVLLADPSRDRWPARERARVAALLLLAEPGRLLRLGAALGLLVVVSTVLFAALLTITVSLAALIAANAVLPAADRLSERPEHRFPPLLLRDATGVVAVAGDREAGDTLVA